VWRPRAGRLRGGGGGQSGEYLHLTQCDPRPPLKNPGYAPASGLTGQKWKDPN